MKNLLLLVLALTCFACSLPIQDEPIGTTEQAVSTVCDPRISFSGPDGSWFEFDVYNFGVPACTTTNNVLVSVAWCRLHTNGSTSACTNIMSYDGPHLLAGFGQAGFNRNFYLSGIVCEGNPDGVPSWIAGQRVQVFLDWTSNTGVKKLRVGSYDCL